MLSWSVIEYGKRMGNQVANARTAIRWATDYLLKASAAVPNRLYVGVGDPNADHKCWERPEDMDTPRTVYSVSPNSPGSDVAGETAAALAAASIVFRTADKGYSQKLLATAKKVLDFAVKYQGKYSDSLGNAVCPFYCSYSGYKVRNRQTLNSVTNFIISVMINLFRYLARMSYCGELHGSTEQQATLVISIT